jgi:Right handed beta helix region
MRIHVFLSAIVAAATLALSLPAQAQNGTLTRSFVSSAGVDTNACSITAPCATFAHAYTVIGANGIIAALDPGKYGPLSITTPVTVNGNGWAAITAPAGGNGITIAAGTGNVILTGLEVDGAGAGYNGIVFQSGASLTISNCIVKDFVEQTNNGLSGLGISIQPTGGSTIDFTIVNTTVLNNKFAGIGYIPVSGSATANGAIDHVVATNNVLGIDVETALASGGTANVSISNSVASNNTGNGITVLPGSGTITATIDNDELNNNAYGVYDSGSVTIVLSRSVITNNTQYGILNQGTVETYGDNRYEANANSNGVFGNALQSVTAQ